MYLTHPLMVLDPCAKYGMPMSQLTEITGPGHKDMKKAYKFYLQVKGQHRIGIMNVHNTLSYGDTSMFQIW